MKLHWKPRLGGWDTLLILIPIALWTTGVFSREKLIRTHCIDRPDGCQISSIPWPDGGAARRGINSVADGWSFTTQYTAGGVAIGAPLVFHAATVLISKIHPATAAISYTTDFALILQAALWNGTFTEWTRIAVSRPRPFVYRNPSYEGVNPDNYTSFYSGHTSFVAAASTMLFLLLFGRGAPRWVLIIAFLNAVVLTVSTGAFRVIAGRHFMTDAIVATIAGAAAAFAVMQLNKKLSRAKQKRG